MQQFRPFASFEETNGVGLIEEGEELKSAPQASPNWAPTEDISSFPPNTTSPLNLFPGQFVGTDTRITEQLEPIAKTSPVSTGPLSLASALKATMSAGSTADKRIVIIPGDKRRKQPTADSAAPARRISLRLRHSIVLAIIGVILLITLLSLTPLASGQGSPPVLIRFGNWVHSQVVNWQIMSHDNTPPVAQNNGPDLQAPPPMYLPKSQYVAIAQQDAMNAGISPDYFARQINLESGFNPNAYSPSGAEGIAQFMPATARGLGIDPWDPIQALNAAANMMASYNNKYGGNYAMALAAYNGGSGTVQYAVDSCGSNWMNCLPAQSRNYIRVIMGI
jgi:Transglycosylase SLT domain